MTDISKYTGRFRLATASDTNASKVVKKTRESHVCTQCRISKTRCDKGKPCTSCIKRNDGPSCSYGKDGDMVEHRTAAEERLMRLESLVTQLMQNSATPSDHRKPVTPPENEADLAPVGRGMTAQMKYPTVLEDIMDNIQELKLALPSIETDVEQVLPVEYSMRGSARIFASSSKYTLEQILAQYLPDRSIADDLLKGYMQGDSFIQPFLHAQSFWQQYDDFWCQPQATPPLWVSILFSVFTMTAMGRETISLVPEQASQDSPKARYHAAAGECLALGKYYQAQEYAPQALLLYAHCVTLKSLDPSQEAGAMMSMAVRSAYQLGYHRDPDVFGKFSVFEGEMRRRFWASCKQVDMMTAFQLGLPGNIRPENCDTRSPRNLLDTDFGPDSLELPPSRPESEATPVLWFIVKDRLASSFIKVCQDALSLTPKPDEHVRTLDQDIRDAHETVPTMLRVYPISESTTASGFLIMARYYLELLHLKSLAILHKRRMLIGHPWSTRMCIDAGLQIVRMVVEVYKEFAPGGRLHRSRWLFNVYYMSDFLLGVVILCLYTKSSLTQQPRADLLAVNEGSEIFSLLEGAHAICVDKASASRDARKVALAIRIAIDGIRKSAVHDSLPNQLFDFHPTGQSIQEVDFAASANWLDPLVFVNPQEEDGSFQGLDTFSFLNPL